MNKKVKKGLDIAAIVLAAIIFLIGMGMLSLSISQKNNADGVPRLFGASFLSIQSDSMVDNKGDEFGKGSFNVGDVVIIKKPKSSDEIKVGTVITFRTLKDGKPALNTHRVIAIDEFNKYITKGDNAEGEDAVHLSFNDVIGVYSFKLPGLGHFIEFLKSWYGFLIVIILPLGAFLGYRIYLLVKVIMQMKKEKLAETAGDTQALQDELAALRAKVAALGEDKPENSNIAQPVEKYKNIEDNDRPKNG